MYVGEATTRILSEAAFFSPAGLSLRPAGFLRDREPLQLGPFRVTPYLVDHSAYDAYALLVEAGGRRLFYSGDLRAHGRKPGTFRRLLDDPPRDIDVLLLEGTRIPDHGDDDRSPLSEADLELALAERFRRHRGARARARLGPEPRPARHRLPRRPPRRPHAGRRPLHRHPRPRDRPGDDPAARQHDVRVYIPNRQRVLVKRTGEFERTRDVAAHRVYLDELRTRRGSFALLGQPSTVAELARADCLDGATAAWSMWAGYLDAGSGARTPPCSEHSASRSPRSTHPGTPRPRTCSRSPTPSPHGRSSLSTPPRRRSSVRGSMAPK